MSMSYAESRTASMVRGLNTGLLFNDAQRGLFYEIVATQLRAGMPIARVLENMAKSRELPAQLTKVARQCRDAVTNGKPFADGLFRTKCVPVQEVGFIDASERHNTLLQTLDKFGESKYRSQTLFNSVIVPNLYYLFILAMVISMLFAGEGALEAFARANTSAFDMPIAKVIMFTAEYGVSLLVGFAVLSLGCVLGRSSLYKKGRFILGPFDADYRLNVAAKFSDMASLMSKQGLDQGEILRIARMSFQSVYAQRAIGEAISRMSQAEPFERALSGTLLDGSSAALLKELVPNGKPDLYPRAFESVAALIRIRINQHYSMLRRMLALLSLTAAASLLVLIIIGVLDSSSLYQ